MRFHARTIRLRLTLIYGVVFLVTGGVLLTIGYFLVRHNLDEHLNLHRLAKQRYFAEVFSKPVQTPHNHPPPHSFNGGANSAVRAAEGDIYAQFASNALHRLLVEYLAALAAMTGVSVAAGWLMAGRALSPLRSIIATAQRVSSENLGERIALAGPADELKELADTFDGMLSRLDSAFASQQHFVANASHELRTPLAIMRTEVDVTLADPDADAAELRAMGEAVRETIDRSEALIAGLLTLARSETISGREEAVDLAALAGDCITDLHARAQVAEVMIDDDLQPAVARGDAALLERMLINLVDNGIRHNHPGGQLRISTATVGESAQVLVANGGAVIDPQQAQTLAEPFRRLSRKPGGFGLGLSIVRSVAEAHGGSMRITAPPSGGLEVLATVPAEPAAAGAAGPRRRRSLTKS